MFWLNSIAPSNIPVMSRTLEVSHLEISLLNFAAFANMNFILVTCPVFQVDKSPLNAALPPNPVKDDPSFPSILVTLLVSHFGITP